MRIKSLFILASILVLPLAITSCLDSDNNDIEPSSDDLITAFSLDAIYGKTYVFTIDQLKGEIYNADSVPFSADTIINKILITTLTTNGFVTTGAGLEGAPYLQDTLFNLTDSIDFIKHNPLKLRVRAADGVHFKEYSIRVLRHQVDPDTLIWGNDPAAGNNPHIPAFTGGDITDAAESKALLLGNDILVYASDGTAWKGVLTTTAPFQPLALTGWPANMKISSLLDFKDTLYGATEDGKVFQSTDGATWTQTANDFYTVNLITTFDNTIAGIIKMGENNVFAAATVNTADGSLGWNTAHVTVPDNFPTGRLSATKAYPTPTGGRQALIISTPASGATATYPWFSNNGMDWGEMTPRIPGETKYALPAMQDPTILYYGNTIYAFGHTEADGFSYIYTSTNGIVWEKIDKKFMFPLQSDGTSVFKDRTGGYAVATDKDNYIWMFWNNTDEAWRGKWNKLGFEIQ